MTTTTHPSAAERLAASLHEAAPKNHAPGPLIRSICQGSDAHLPQATAILAADPTLAQDIEDGTELRLLREAPDLIAIECVWHPMSSTWKVTTWVHRGGTEKYGPTVAAAAKACREALEATR